MLSVWGQKVEIATLHEAALRTHTKIYKLLFCKEEGGNMKGFKKGIALIAVLAFLITAILPVGIVAASGSEPLPVGPTVGKVYTDGDTINLGSNISTNEVTAAGQTIYALAGSKITLTASTSDETAQWIAAANADGTGTELNSANLLDVANTAGGWSLMTITGQTGSTCTIELTVPTAKATDAFWVGLATAGATAGTVAATTKSFKLQPVQIAPATIVGMPAGDGTDGVQAVGNNTGRIVQGYSGTAPSLKVDKWCYVPIGATGALALQAITELGDAPVPIDITLGWKNSAAATQDTLWLGSAYNDTTTVVSTAVDGEATLNGDPFSAAVTPSANTYQCNAIPQAALAELPASINGAVYPVYSLSVIAADTAASIPKVGDLRVVPDSVVLGFPAEVRGIVSDGSATSFFQLVDSDTLTAAAVATGAPATAAAVANYPNAVQTVWPQMASEYNYKVWKDTAAASGGSGADYNVATAPASVSVVKLQAEEETSAGPTYTSSATVNLIAGIDTPLPTAWVEQVDDGSGAATNGEPVAAPSSAPALSWTGSGGVSVNPTSGVASISTATDGASAAASYAAATGATTSPGAADGSAGGIATSDLQISYAVNGVTLRSSGNDTQTDATATAYTGVPAELQVQWENASNAAIFPANADQVEIAWEVTKADKTQAGDAPTPEDLGLAAGTIQTVSDLQTGGDYSAVVFTPAAVGCYTVTATAQSEGAAVAGQQVTFTVTVRQPAAGILRIVPQKDDLQPNGPGLDFSAEAMTVGEDGSAAWAPSSDGQWMLWTSGTTKQPNPAGLTLAPKSDDEGSSSRDAVTGAASVTVTADDTVKPGDTYYLSYATTGLPGSSNVGTGASSANGLAWAEITIGEPEATGAVLTGTVTGAVTFELDQAGSTARMLLPNITTAEGTPAEGSTLTYQLTQGETSLSGENGTGTYELGEDGSFVPAAGLATTYTGPLSANTDLPFTVTVTAADGSTFADPEGEAYTLSEDKTAATFAYGTVQQIEVSTQPQPPTASAAGRSAAGARMSGLGTQSDPYVLTVTEAADSWEFSVIGKLPEAGANGSYKVWKVPADSDEPAIEDSWIEISPNEDPETSGDYPQRMTVSVPGGTFSEAGTYTYNIGYLSTGFTEESDAFRVAWGLTIKITPAIAENSIGVVARDPASASVVYDPTTDAQAPTLTAEAIDDQGNPYTGEVTYTWTDADGNTVCTGAEFTPTDLGTEQAEKTYTCTITVPEGSEVTVDPNHASVVFTVSVEPQKLPAFTAEPGSVTGPTAEDPTCKVTVPEGTQSVTIKPDSTGSWKQPLPAGSTINDDGSITVPVPVDGDLVYVTDDETEIPVTVETGSIPDVPATGITVTPDTLTLVEGATSQLTATVEPNNATDKTVTWVSGNDSVATVDATGLVTAVLAGTATITATNAAGQSVTCAVTVNPAPPAISEIRITPPSAVIIAGNTLDFAAQGVQNGTNVTVKGTWSLDPAATDAVKIDAETGAVTTTAEATGSWSAVFTPENGQPASADFTVVPSLASQQKPNKTTVTNPGDLFDAPGVNGNPASYIDPADIEAGDTADWIVLDKPDDFTGGKVSRTLAPRVMRGPAGNIVPSVTVTETKTGGSPVTATGAVVKDGAVTFSSVGSYQVTYTWRSGSETLTETINVAVLGRLYEIASPAGSPYPYTAAAGMARIADTPGQAAQNVAAGNAGITVMSNETGANGRNLFWNAPPAAPATDAAQYIWYVVSNPGSAVSEPTLAGPGLSKLGTTPGLYYGSTSATQIVVNGLNKLGQSATIYCQAVVPNSWTNNAADTAHFIEMNSALPSYVQNANGLSNSEALTLTVVDPVLESVQPDSGLSAIIGSSLNDSKTVVWNTNGGPAVYRWVMQPQEHPAGGIDGPAITVTASNANPNLLTFTTGVIGGTKGGTYDYWLVPFDQNGNPLKNANGDVIRVPMTLTVSLTAPQPEAYRTYVAPGVEGSTMSAADMAAGSIHGAASAVFDDTRSPIYVQINNLPSFAVQTSMQDSNPNSWQKTRWAVSGTNYVNPNGAIVDITWEDFNGKSGRLTPVSTGADQSGDLVSTYQVQPAEVREAVRVWQAAGSPADTSTVPLFYYALVQYGSNPNCSVIMGPFALTLVRDGGQTLYALQENGALSGALGAPKPAAISALVSSQAATELDTKWIPQAQPQNVTQYLWTIVTSPDGTVNVAGAGVKGRNAQGGASWTTAAGTQTTSLSNFTAEGRWVITCQAQNVTGGMTTDIQNPVTFYVNVGSISVVSNTAQADKFTYAVQPASGYFKDTAAAPGFNLNYNDAGNDLPSAAPGSWNNLLTIGNVSGLTGTTVNGQTPSGEVVPVSVNGRFELWFNPDGIWYGNPLYGGFTLSSDPNSTYDVQNADGTTTTVNNYWENWVTLEWRYKTSQYMEDDGNGLDIPQGMGFSGVNSPLLTSGPLTSAMDGWQFGLEIHDKKNDALYTSTRWVLLDLDGVNPATQPTGVVTSYPAASGSNVNLTVGSDVTLTASAQSSIPAADLTYQWQSKAPVSSGNPEPEWNDIAGAAEASYSLSNVSDAVNGMSYRCILTNTAYAGGVKVPSNELTLRITPADGAVVIESPQTASLVNLYASRTLETSVTARTDNGSPVAYQWFVKSYTAAVPTGNAAVTTTDAAAALIAASGSQLITGATEPTLTTGELTEGVYEYTCRVVNVNDASKVLNSAPVYVVVTENSRVPYVWTPSARPVTSIGVTNGEPVSMNCDAWAASLEPLDYQWQTASSADGPWTDLTCKDKTLTINNTTTQLTGSYFRCVVTNTVGGESSISPLYRLNIWNVANVPVITQSPASQEITWNDGIGGGEFVLTSTVSVAQGADHNLLIPVWHTPAGDRSQADNPSVVPGQPSYEPVVSLEQSTVNGFVTYTSTLTMPVKGNDVDTARLYSGEYSVTWFNNQEREEDSNYDEANMQSPADTARLLAPQVTSGKADINILIPGTPKIVTKSEATVTKAVGETASFSVTAVANGDAGELVYVWQMTCDGGRNWNNVLSADGTGQFTNTFTTAPLTQTMFDNSTASNVAGIGESGTIGNANTVYEYRVIVANRATGAKATSGAFKLIITQDAVEPPVTEEPTLTPGEGSSITIEGTAPNRYATGITVSQTGTAVEDFLDELGMDVPAGYSLRIVGADGEVLDASDLVYTGCVLQLVKDETDEVVDSATIIVRGDVLGANNTGTVGTLAINQLVRMAQDLNETRPLEGIFEIAGDFNGNSSIDIADLVAEAQLLALHEPVQK